MAPTITREALVDMAVKILALYIPEKSMVHAEKMVRCGADEYSRGFFEVAIRISDLLESGYALTDVVRSLAGRIPEIVDLRSELWWGDSDVVHVTKTEMLSFAKTLSETEFVSPDRTLANRTLKKVASNDWKALAIRYVDCQNRVSDFGRYLNLLLKHFIQDDSCPRCLQDSESVSHALIFCPKVASIWGNMAFLTHVNSTDFNSYGEIAKYVLNSHGVDAFKTLLLHSWVAWTDRNNYHFQQRTANVESTLIGFSKFVGDYAIQSNARTVSCPPRPVQSLWLPPPNGRLKINVDAHCSSSAGTSAGVVVRDSYGFLQAVAVKHFRHKWPPDIAEAMAFLFGLQTGLSLGLRSVIIESDSLTVINGLLQDSQSLSYLGSILDFIRLSAVSFTHFSCTHVGRAGNTVAHHAARFDIGDVNELLIVSDFPQGLLSLAKMDI